MMKHTFHSKIKKMAASLSILSMAFVFCLPSAQVLAEAVPPESSPVSSASQNTDASSPSESSASSVSNQAESTSQTSSTSSSSIADSSSQTEAVSSQQTSEASSSSSEELILPSMQAFDPASIVEISAMDTSLTYDVAVVNDSNYNNDIKYTITNATVTTLASGYASLTIAAPVGLDTNYVLPANWSVYHSDSITNFIITTPATNGNATAIKNFLQNNLSFTLSQPDVFTSSGAKITINISANLVSSRIDGNGKPHYYEFVPASKIAWLNAYNSSKTRSFNGLQGYLATITSQAEQDFIYNSIAKKGGWLGATRLRNKTTNTPIHDEDVLPNQLSSYETSTAIANNWYWADGPEAGLVFLNSPTAGPTVPGAYSNWTTASNEPNNSNNAENCMQFAFSGSLWNDLPNTPTNYIDGYYVEYGGYDDEVPEQEYPGYESPVPAPVQIEYLTSNNTQLMEGQYLFGDLNEAYTVPPAPAAPAGYTYQGLKAGSAPEQGTFSGTLQTVTYVYQPNEYTVSFDLNYTDSPTNPDSIPIVYDAAYGTLPAPSRLGYSFEGWYTTSEGTGTEIINDSLVKTTDNQTLFAKWKADTYSVSFDLDYTDAPSAPADQTVTFNTPYGSLPVVTRDQYTFLGWYADLSDDNSIVSDTNVVEATTNHTLHARWALTSQLIDFNLNYSDASTAPDSMNIEYNAAYGTLPTVTRSGYYFEGWYYDADASGTPVTGNTVNTLIDNHTLYAKWTINSYIVGFNLNFPKAPAGPDSKTIVFNTEYGELPLVERAGYSFEGWYIDIKGTGKPITATSIMQVTASHSLYAKWTANNYTLRFNGNYAGAPEARDIKNVVYNEKYGTLPTLSREGYTFDGWYMNPEGTGSNITGDTIETLLADHTLYAQWHANTYQVSFNLNYSGSGIAPASQKVVFGKTYEALPTITRTGFVFAGWYSNEDGSGTPVTALSEVAKAGNHTLFAQWTPDTSSSSSSVSSTASSSSANNISSTSPNPAPAQSTAPSRSTSSSSRTKANSVVSSSALVSSTTPSSSSSSKAVPSSSSQTKTVSSVVNTSSAQLESLNGNQTPTTGLEGKPSGWSLISLIATVLTLIAAAIALVLRVSARVENKWSWVIGGIVLSIASLLLLFFTNDFTQKMVWFNWATLLLVGLAVIEWVLFILFTRNSQKTSEE